MDSFYDQPRNAPKQTNVNRIINSPLIPEVSIIQPPIGTNPRLQHGTPKESYNVWKARNFSDIGESAKENSQPMANRQFCDASFRKQVRFDSPKLHRSNSTESYPVCKETNENFHRSNSATSKPFEQIYMDNIPNRKLDLSMIDSVRQNKCGSMSDDHDRIRQNKENANCYDIYNYKRSSDDQNNVFTKDILESRNLLHKLTNESNEQTSKDNFVRTESKITPEFTTFGDKQFRSDNRPSDAYSNSETRVRYSNNSYCDKPREIPQKPAPIYDYIPTNHCQTLQRNEDRSGDPTLKDLLKVIQQQNEQILILQKQVSCLLETKSNQKQIEHDDTSNSNIEQSPFRKSKKGPLSKFAIDVMTSFEVSIRPPQNNGRSKYAREILDTPKIQEIVDDRSGDKDDPGNVLDGIKKNEFECAKDKDDVSISLMEPLRVGERCPSPEQSIHVDMQDFSSDDEDSSGSSSDIGWTLYNNIMGQVNNIFQNQGTQPGNPQGTSNDTKEKTLKTVKEATMKHLKSVGVNLPLIDEDEDSTDAKDIDKYNPTQVSFAVKQLLMKYLPNEHLAKLTYNETKRLQTKQSANGGNLIKPRPEFSFATVQYMKKYNLLASDGSKELPQTKPMSNNPKILDVTALKRQPKLL